MTLLQRADLYIKMLWHFRGEDVLPALRIKALVVLYGAAPGTR